MKHHRPGNASSSIALILLKAVNGHLKAGAKKVSLMVSRTFPTVTMTMSNLFRRCITNILD
jgi:hypothetical protein